MQILWLRYRWKDNIKMNLREIGWDGVDWTHLAENRDWWHAVEHNNEPSYSIKSGEFLE
jgi:hypothetical protein